MQILPLVDNGVHALLAVDYLLLHHLQGVEYILLLIINYPDLPKAPLPYHQVEIEILDVQGLRFIFQYFIIIDIAL